MVLGNSMCHWLKYGLLWQYRPQTATLSSEDAWAMDTITLFYVSTGQVNHHGHSWTYWPLTSIWPLEVAQSLGINLGSHMHILIAFVCNTHTPWKSNIPDAVGLWKPTLHHSIFVNNGITRVCLYKWERKIQRSIEKMTAGETFTSLKTHITLSVVPSEVWTRLEPPLYYWWVHESSSKFLAFLTCALMHYKKKICLLAPHHSSINLACVLFLLPIQVTFGENVFIQIINKFCGFTFVFK